MNPYVDVFPIHTRAEVRGKADRETSESDENYRAPHRCHGQRWMVQCVVVCSAESSTELKGMPSAVMLATVTGSKDKVEGSVAAR
jgi:hypothetical protein